MTDTWPRAVSASAMQWRQQLRSQIDQFVRRQQLPADFDLLVDDYLLPLAVWLAQLRKPGQLLVVGICGGQGSGKSTLTEFLQMVWAQMALHAVGFSLDDLYLTRAERMLLAERVHPLLATRGVPGTHDVQLGLDTIAALRARDVTRPVPIPRFDKSIDDRAPAATWTLWQGAADILLFEGWCVGARPWLDAAEPINRLEREADPDGRWRNYVNSQLAGPYRRLFAELDRLLMLKVPDMDCVLEWRRLQEHRLRARTGGGMSDAALERFVQHYERITLNLLGDMPPRADCVFELGRDHRIAGLRLNSAAE
ncbi:phosphoribulokinase [Microbulbifer sp. SAOS-129_SWC]|uniref:phosphoribulokinase n=1 Tax=Microbulbifer sp. SAOS-129_SWC TaxID=3145235 RepID=UPI003217992F